MYRVAGPPLMALALSFGAVNQAFGLNNQAGVMSVFEKAPVSFLEAVSAVEVHLEVGSSQSLAWVLVLMSVLVVLLLCVLIVSDVSQPFEVMQPPRKSDPKQPQQHMRAFPQAERGQEFNPRPVPANVPPTGGFDGPRPVPAARSRPAQYNTAGSPPSQPVLVVRDDAHPYEERRLPTVPVQCPMPQLCPRLVLPTQTVGDILIENLMEGVGSFDVLGVKDKDAPLLNVRIKQELTVHGNKRTIQLFFPHNPSLLASIGTTMIAGTGLEVRRGDDALKEGKDPHFGWLRPGPGGSFVLTAEDQELFYILCEGQGYRIVVAAPEGGMASIASAALHPIKEEFLQIKVDPDVDAILVICCVLAAAIFGGGDALPSLA